MNISEMLNKLPNKQLTLIAEAFSMEPVKHVLSEGMRQLENDLRFNLCQRAEIAMAGANIPPVVYEIYGAQLTVLAELAGLPVHIEEMITSRKKIKTKPDYTSPIYIDVPEWQPETMA